MFKMTSISTLEVHENTEGPLKEGLGLSGMGGRLPAQDLYFQSPEDLPHVQGLHFLSTSPSTRNIKNIFLCFGISSFSFISSTILVFLILLNCLESRSPVLWQESWTKLRPSLPTPVSCTEAGPYRPEGCQLHTRWHPVGSLKLAMAGAFTLKKLAKATDQSFVSQRANH